MEVYNSLAMEWVNKLDRFVDYLAEPQKGYGSLPDDELIGLDTQLRYMAQDLKASGVENESLLWFLDNAIKITGRMLTTGRSTGPNTFLIVGFI